MLHLHDQIHAVGLAAPVFGISGSTSPTPTRPLHTVKYGLASLYLYMYLAKREMGQDRLKYSVLPNANCLAYRKIPFA